MCFAKLASSPVIANVSHQVECCIALPFTAQVPMVPTPQLPSQRDTAIWRIMDHLCSHKTAEISTTAVGTAFSSLSSMVHLFIISTPTESHFHKSIHSIIVIFYLRCSSTRKVHRSKVRTKYCSIMVSLILTFPFQETISVQPSLWLISQLQRDSSPHSICPIPSVSGIWEWDHMSQIAIAGTLCTLIYFSSTYIVQALATG